MSLKLEPISKCVFCNKNYDEEYTRMLDNGKSKSKHLTIIENHTFESAFGTEHEWSVKVVCSCGQTYGFSDST